MLWLWLTPLHHFLRVKGSILNGLNATSLVLSEAVLAEGVSMLLATEGALVMLGEHRHRRVVTTLRLQGESCANGQHSRRSPSAPRGLCVNRCPWHLRQSFLHHWRPSIGASINGHKGPLKTTHSRSCKHQTAQEGKPLHPTSAHHDSISGQPLNRQTSLILTNEQLLFLDVSYALEDAVWLFVKSWSKLLRKRNQTLQGPASRRSNMQTCKDVGQAFDHGW